MAFSHKLKVNSVSSWMRALFHVSTESAVDAAPANGNNQPESKAYEPFCRTESKEVEGSIKPSFPLRSLATLCLVDCEILGLLSPSLP